MEELLKRLFNPSRNRVEFKMAAASGAAFLPSSSSCFQRQSFVLCSPTVSRRKSPAALQDFAVPTHADL